MDQCARSDSVFSQDIAGLQESSGNDKAFERELLDAYLESCEPHLKKLPDLLKVRKEQHKGSCR